MFKFFKNVTADLSGKVVTIGIDDKIITIEDYSLINKLLPMFQKEIANDLKEILNYK